MLDILYLFFIAPIEICMKAVFDGGYALTHSYGLALIGISLVVNTAVLPIYNKAESWQEEERELKKRMGPKLQMIRRCFKGQERFAMISTLYRQFGYSPLLTLRASIGILLQIPFFFAAYQLLSNMAVLNGVSFGPLRNLGAPDALLAIGGFSINVLPLLMTAINLVSAFFYTHGLSRSDKMQLYGMAALFLVLLYNSPAGLTFYWTLNNVYSLCKNIVQKNWMKRPGWTGAMRRLASWRDRARDKVGALVREGLAFRGRLSPAYLLIGASALFLLWVICGKRQFSLLKCGLFLGASLLVVGVILAHKRLPCLRRFSLFQVLAGLTGLLAGGYIVALYGIVQGNLVKVAVRLLLVAGALGYVFFCKKYAGKLYAAVMSQKKELAELFLSATTLLAFLVLVYTPFMLYSTGPEVFQMELEDFASNRFGIFLAVMLCVAITGVLMRPLRWLFGTLFGMLTLAALGFCFIVAPNVGVMDGFMLEKPEALGSWYLKDLDVAVILAVGVLFLVIVGMRRIQSLSHLFSAFLVILVITTGVHFHTAKEILAHVVKEDVPNEADLEIPTHIKDFFTFSKHGKNIVVVMLDMFTGGNMNQLLERHPELKTELDGFTWYEDVVTAGSATIFGKPGILGGEAAHPLMLNKDEEKSLEEKISAAYGQLFGKLQEHNFRISAYDSEFLSRDLLKPYLAEYGKLHLIISSVALWPGALKLWEKKHGYKLTRIQDMRKFFNVFGLYNVAPLGFKNVLYDNGSWKDSESVIKNKNILNTSTWLADLELLPEASNVTDVRENSFIYVKNLLTHGPWILDEKGMPSMKGGWGPTRRLAQSGLSEEHLRTEYFALRKLITWFKWMKENHVYNNTQIIIVSDHGHGDSTEIVKFWQRIPPIYLHGLLLVKANGAHGELKIDRTSLMANWDVPTIILNELAEGNGAKKSPWLDANRERLHVAGDWRREAHPDNKYVFSTIYSLRGPIYKKESWHKIQ